MGRVGGGGDLYATQRKTATEGRLWESRVVIIPFWVWPSEGPHNMGDNELRSKLNVRTALAQGNLQYLVSKFLVYIVVRASLRFKKDRENIDSFWRFIDKFRLFSNRSEALIVVVCEVFLGCITQHCHISPPPPTAMVQTSSRGLYTPLFCIHGEQYRAVRPRKG